MNSVGFFPDDVESAGMDYQKEPIVTSGGEQVALKESSECPVVEWIQGQVAGEYGLVPEVTKTCSAGTYSAPPVHMDGEMFFECEFSEATGRGGSVLLCRR